MEPFRLTPQSVAFLSVMAGVTVVVAVAAPFGSIALGAVALLAIGVVLIKAMLRARRWWPLTAVEGTVALSGVVLLVGGLSVMAYSMVRLGSGHPFGMSVGWPSMADGARTSTITRSVSYSDPQMQQRLKEGLRAAGVPFTVKMQDGKEFVGWDAEHAGAAQAVDEKIRQGPLPAGRNVHFPDPNLTQQFTDWLAQKGVEHRVVSVRGEDYVVWDEARGDLAREFIESRSADCKGKVAAGKRPAARSLLMGLLPFISRKEASAKVARDRYLGLMKACLTNMIYGDPNATQDGVPVFNAALRAEGRDWPPYAHTMVGLKRLDNVQFCVEDVIARGVPGDLMETGVWRGGTVIFMRAILAAHGVTDRRVWAADSFAGLPAPDAAKYPQDAGLTLNEFAQLAVSLEQVQNNFRAYGLLDDQVRFLKGWFRDTLPAAPVERLALLRLDGDLYESTMDALTHLYPKLAKGGYVIIDDYRNIPACARAVTDYRRAHGITEEIESIDWCAVFWKRRYS